MSSTTNESDSGRRLKAELDLAIDAEPLHHARIVMVDDDESIVRLLSIVLGMAGATDLHGFTDAAAAVASCTEQRPDLLLLDLHIGQIDGYEVLDALRVAAGQVPPVIVLSGEATKQAKARATAAGVSDFLPKPFDLVDLVARVRTTLEGAAADATGHGPRAAVPAR
jgi:DNA-binding response OmpR family regulator